MNREKVEKALQEAMEQIENTGTYITETDERKQNEMRKQKVRRKAR